MGGVAAGVASQHRYKQRPIAGALSEVDAGRCKLIAVEGQALADLLTGDLEGRAGGSRPAQNAGVLVRDSRQEREEGRAGWRGCYSPSEKESDSDHRPRTTDHHARLGRRLSVVSRRVAVEIIT